MKVAMMPDPIPGRWYWVRVATVIETPEQGPWWFPAQCDPTAGGGWTNNDCWEDYDHQVQEWQLIPPPSDRKQCECGCGVLVEDGLMERAHPEDYRGDRG
jgi:hypothetical protein